MRMEDVSAQWREVTLVREGQVPMWICCAYMRATVYSASQIMECTEYLNMCVCVCVCVQVCVQVCVAAGGYRKWNMWQVLAI